MSKIRVGVVGCGDVAQHTYLPGLARLHREGVLDFVAVADAIEERAAAFAEKYAVPHAYAGADALLHSGVDLVVNLTPMQAHAEVTLAALAAGKHVYTEKPVATSLEDANAIVEAASAAGLAVGAAPALLTHPDIQQTLRWLWADVIGRVCFVRARASNPGPDRITDFLTDPTWFHKTGGGPLFDLGIYPLHVITGALGPARRVTAFSGIALPERVVVSGAARGKCIQVESDDNTHLLLDFGDATFASIDATYCVLSSQGPRMEFYGASGVMNLASTVDEPPVLIFREDDAHGLRGWMTPEKVYRGRVNPPRHPADPSAYSLVNGVAHMVEALEGRSPLLLTAEHAVHVLEILLAVQQSAREGRAVEISSTFARPALNG
jgi:predicted dehydrogenase